MTRHVAVVGLGFGDCGKGKFVDALARRLDAHTVVRFNGGGQAAHNVVLPDGRHHTFSQFGAASFVPGVATVLAAPVVVHPGALVVEASTLQAKGVADTWNRLWIDERCRVTTPALQAAGRLREWQRGAQAHGSCGVGVGETVRHALRHPDETLRYADLLRPALAMAKLRAQCKRLFAEFSQPADPAAAQEWALLAHPQWADAWLTQAHGVALRSPPRSPEALRQRLHQAGTVLHEGAQGVLLDEWRGFHPHTTWSSTLPAAAQAVVDDLALSERVVRWGVLRPTLTRHGAGPLPTHDPALDAACPEAHNASVGWQGPFRVGHPDAVLLRYALAVAGPLDGLLLSHLDLLSSNGERARPTLRWAAAHVTADGRSWSQLPVSLAPDLDHQERLTRQLQSARAVWGDTVRDTADWQAHLEALAGCPVAWRSDGATHHHVQPGGQ